MEKCNIIECDIFNAIEQLKSRWTSVVVYSLFESSKTFSQIEESFEFLTATQLNRTLKTLQKDNILEKNNQVYSLTTKGLELVEVLNHIDEWYSKFEEKEE